MKSEFRNSIALVCVALAFSSAQVQSAAVGSFTLVQSMSQFRRLHTATLLANGQVLVAGGAPVGPAAISEIYDAATETWTNSGTMNTGREFHTATLLMDGTVMVTGGQTANRLLAGTEVYDPATGSWTNAGFLNEARELHTATLLTSGLVLVAGGFQNIASAEEYDPTTGQWDFTGSMNVPRYVAADRLHGGSTRDAYRLVAARRQSPGDRRRWLRRAR
jgi:hypothetical protein